MSAASASPGIPALSLLIPAYNEERLIGGVIDSVRASFAAIAPLPYEIIVCDNNSTDRTAAIAKSKGARVIFEPHNQIAKARNTAAAQARGRWLIFLDGDTHLNPLLLKATITALSQGKICAGGAPVRFDRERIGFVAVALTSFWNRLSSLCQLAAGSYVFCHREAWAEVGGFDERVYAGEELFFSQKLKRWAREHGMRFKILCETPVITSARKMDWYGSWGLLWQVVRMAHPFAMTRRERCGLWYSRPTEAERS